MASSSQNGTLGDAQTERRLELDPDNDPSVEDLGPVVKRDPVIKLLSTVTGLEPLSWSEDHRLSASTASGIALMEVVCDVHSKNQDLVLHRTHIPLPDKVCELKVGPEAELEKAREKFSFSPDPSITQPFMLDRIINPSCGPPKGILYCSWSPLGCDANGRCLLARLSLDRRLTIHSSQKRLQWSTLVDLTQIYGESLEGRGYSLQEGEPPCGAGLADLEELQRRFRMQTAVRAEWSSVCTTQHVQTNNECKDVETVLLAVLMENGDLVVWQFRLPFLGKDSVLSCNTLRSGVSSPSVLAWWEYEHSGRKMSGLIVGSAVGPVKILPVNLKAVKGYFTLRQPVVLWHDTDQIPVHNIKCVALLHPVQKCNCSLVVAARGCYVFWCLLVISKSGLSVQNSHVTGLHSLPIIAMTAARQGGSVYTCSLDGAVKKLTPVFSEQSLSFHQEDVRLPEGLRGRRLYGASVSPNGAYLALVSSEGLVHGLHPVTRPCQVNFLTLKRPEDAGVELLEATPPSLFRQADLLDLVRWRVLRERRIPPHLQAELDRKLDATGSAYLWRLKLFLVRVLYQSLRAAPAEARWRPTHEDTKVFVGDEEEEGDEGEGGEERGGGGGERGGGGGGRERGGGVLNLLSREPQVSEEKISEVLAWMASVEAHLTREHMKRVLGEVYLHTWITENTSIPTMGVCDFLSKDPSYDDRAAKVLIGHIQKKMNKQTFPEYCSLCKEVLPFKESKQAVCINGHVWFRCVLSYQTCQTFSYRRCLLQDSIARMPVPEDPDWIKRILQGPCTFCDSPLF
ncbi:general transcription factor 3C polypeptide 4 [Hypomesus transpacificus]|uniref:general transcription factor 3C polypeptide 4 n=1 Tax=Hypomesus transpacificus TaxID=137520 RepID=UPI001F07556C|nr:general transcription factor 3C polypeptide 4 [Hypomesus transpacificus]